MSRHNLSFVTKLGPKFEDRSQSISNFYTYVYNTHIRLQEFQKSKDIFSSFTSNAGDRLGSLIAKPRPDFLQITGSLETCDDLINVGSFAFIAFRIRP